LGSVFTFSHFLGEEPGRPRSISELQQTQMTCETYGWEKMNTDPC
jgi:hypothetical protein